MDRGGLGPSFAPPIFRTVDLSNVAGALSFSASAFFATNAAAPTTTPGIVADRIAFATAAGAGRTTTGAATSVASVARTAWCFGGGVTHMVQYLPPLLLMMWTWRLARADEMACICDTRSRTRWLVSVSLEARIYDNFTYFFVRHFLDRTYE
jgi:hypothetical protein